MEIIDRGGNSHAFRTLDQATAEWKAAAEAKQRSLMSDEAFSLPRDHRCAYCCCPAPSICCPAPSIQMPMLSLVVSQVLVVVPCGGSGGGGAAVVRETCLNWG